VKVLLAFIFIVAIGAMRDSKRGRVGGPLPLLVLCVSVSAVYFSLIRFL
jgi:hypothetical protein